MNGGFINEDGDFDMFSYDLYRHFRDNTPEFEELAAMQAGHNDYNVRRGSEPAKSERAEYVSGNYFSTLGVGAFSGRALQVADDREGAAPVAVMSYATWESDYGSDRSVVEARLYVEGQPLTIVGIAPAGFFGDRVQSNPAAILDSALSGAAYRTSEQ